MEIGRRISWWAAGAALLALAWVLWRREPEPMVQARPLGAWIQHYIRGTPAEQSMAGEVLSRVAPMAAPKMAEELLREPPLLEPWLFRAGALARIPHHLLPAPTTLRHSAALRWLDSAGSNASPAAAGLVARLGGESPTSHRDQAGSLLRRLGPAAAPALIAGLDHPDPKIRAETLGLLPGALGDSARLLEFCLAKAADPAAEVRKRAATLLAPGPFAEGEILPPLRRLARDPAPSVREAAVEQLGRPWSGDAVVPLLRSLLEDPVPVVRLLAARSLWAKTRDAGLVLPTLQSGLQETEGWRAALYLGELGPEAAPAVPDLLRLMRRETTYRPFRTPSTTTLALARVGPAAVPGLRELLSHPNPSARLGAILSLGMIGQAAGEAAPDLIGLLEEKDLDFRHLAALSLGQIGVDSPRVLTRLEDCLRAEDIHMRSLAATLLNRLAPDRDWAPAPE